MENYSQTIPGSLEFPKLWRSPRWQTLRILPPSILGSYYYKGFFSITLMALVNAKYEFLFVDIGKNERNSDGGVIEKTEFHTRLRNGTLHLTTTEETVEGLSFVFVADDAFALGEQIFKPFPLKNLSREQIIYNYRLSRARHVVKNAFGIMSNRFRIFRTAINLSSHKIDMILHCCCCVLHNYLRRTSASYMPQSHLDREDTVCRKCHTWRVEKWHGGTHEYSLCTTTASYSTCTPNPSRLHGLLFGTLSCWMAERYLIVLCKCVMLSF